MEYVGKKLGLKLCVAHKVRSGCMVDARNEVGNLQLRNILFVEDAQMLEMAWKNESRYYAMEGRL